MFTTRENLITPILGSISVRQIFRNCRRFNDLRVQTYDLILWPLYLLRYLYCRIVKKTSYVGCDRDRTPNRPGNLHMYALNRIRWSKMRV